MTIENMGRFLDDLPSHEGWSKGPRGPTTAPTCPTSPVALPPGTPVEECEANIRDAIAFHLEGMREAGEAVPEPPLWPPPW